MKRILEKIAKASFKQIGLGITRFEVLDRLRRNENVVDDLFFLKSMNENHVGKLIKLLEHSESQLRQDLFVLSELNLMRDGFFVEFGAMNGIDFSNTYLLENKFGWRGILSEPAKCWHSSLKNNRTADIEFDCIWSETGTSLEFWEANITQLSTISSFRSKDMHGRRRKNGKIYTVNTISLLDLLKKFEAPQVIEYLSIDTEGSEYEILKDFNFNEYKFLVITYEHNFTLDRKKIYDLLMANGYVRKFEHLSKFDDWYVLRDS